MDENPAPGFAAGTRIRTTRGDIAVERLRIGDRLLSGALAATPIRALHHRTIDCAQHPDPASVWPVRVRAGAFGCLSPACDLLLAPGHCLHVGKRPVPLRYLLNGGSIVQVPIDEITYWQVEPAWPGEIIAEGFPTASWSPDGQDYRTVSETSAPTRADAVAASSFAASSFSEYGFGRNTVPSESRSRRSVSSA